MRPIVLATLNARYHHCAFGLRYLLANMGDLRERTELLEFTINQPTLDILGAILARNPVIVGFGVYIWNVDETTRLVADLKRIAPHITVILGGPEVSYETEQQQICQLSDYVITGEADLAFAELCGTLLSSADGLCPTKGSDPLQKVDTRIGEIHGKGSDPFVGKLIHSLPTEDRRTRIIHAPVPDLNQLTLPYDLYSETDIAQRVIYVEASRGCPFTCEFCLSALEIPVRQFRLESFLAAMDQLLSRGTRLFKFVDRTFNLNIRVSLAILEFFLERYQPGMFLHFELIPDRLPESLKEVIARFPAGALQFEVGIQTFNDSVSELISRRQDNHQVEQNLTWLREHTSVHVHADLIVGLPGESMESFAVGFDRLVHLAPHEIQVGILKRLRGTPIIRHDEAWQMIYSPHPPYEILSTSLLDFATIQELRRFAKYWDTIANSGNFVETTPLLWQGLPGEPARSPFAEFRCLANWLFQREGQSHGIALSRLVELLFEYLTQEKHLAPSVAAEAIWRDYQRGGRSDKPKCLRPYITEPADIKRSSSTSAVPKRQGRRLNGVAEER